MSTEDRRSNSLMGKGLYCLGGVNVKTIILSFGSGALHEIRTGKKRFEIRKDFPACGTPFKVLCCETRSGGRITAEFICDAITPIDVSKDGRIKGLSTLGLEATNLRYEEVVYYIGCGRTGFAWHIANMVDYCNTKGKRVMNISEFGLKRTPKTWQYVGW